MAKSSLSVDNKRQVILNGLQLLQQKSGYTQLIVVQKLKVLGFDVSTASLSHLVTGKKKVGGRTLRLMETGVLQLIERELDLQYHPGKDDFIARRTKSWSPDIVQIHSEWGQAQEHFVLHPFGRVSVQEKAAFIKDATKEVIEVGVRLNSYAGYFVSQNESVYKKHVINLLQNGVYIKGYLLDPESQEARMYFEDRAKDIKDEKDAIGDIKKVIDRLGDLSKEFQRLGLPGKFELYTYRHVPFGMMLAVDRAEKSGKMMVSPYLYGINRANCPVMEFTREGQPQLFRTYNDAMDRFIRNAQKIN